jgi:hypothetical protein
LLDARGGHIYLRDLLATEPRCPEFLSRRLVLVLQSRIASTAACPS